MAGKAEIVGLMLAGLTGRYFAVDGWMVVLGVDLLGGKELVCWLWCTAGLIGRGGQKEIFGAGAGLGSGVAVG